MPLTIPDETLEAAGLTPEEARVGVLLRLYAGQLLSAASAMRLTGWSREELDRRYDELDAAPVPLAVIDLEPEVRAWLNTLAGELPQRFGPLVVSDERLAELGLTPERAPIEIACRLFAVELFHKSTATRWLGMTRDEFDGKTHERGLPWIIYTMRMWEQEADTLNHWREQDADADRGGERHVAGAGAGSSESAGPALAAVRAGADPVGGGR